jgi:hypothetical protein
MRRLSRIDHVTYVVRRDTIVRWAWWYLEVLGGTLILRVDDTNPKDKSSMMLWCIDYDDFGVALVAGIDREEKSHVTAFVEQHGDHCVQHVAFQVEDLHTFRDDMTARAGLSLLGPILQRKDAFGWVRQVFAKSHHGDTNPAAAPFTEFVERPNKRGEAFPEISFSADVGTNLYQQAQRAMKVDDRAVMIDFSKMPPGWEVPHSAPRDDEPT